MDHGAVPFYSKSPDCEKLPIVSLLKQPCAWGRKIEWQVLQKLPSVSSCQWMLSAHSQYLPVLLQVFVVSLFECFHGRSHIEKHVDSTTKKCISVGLFMVVLWFWSSLTTYGLWSCSDGWWEISTVSSPRSKHQKRLCVPLLSHTQSRRCSAAQQAVLWKRETGLHCQYFQGSVLKG